jgi:hypothetical protein
MRWEAFVYYWRIEARWVLIRWRVMGCEKALMDTGTLPRNALIGF